MQTPIRITIRNRWRDLCCSSVLAKTGGWLQYVTIFFAKSSKISINTTCINHKQLPAPWIPHGFRFRSRERSAWGEYNKGHFAILTVSTPFTKSIQNMEVGLIIGTWNHLFQLNDTTRFKVLGPFLDRRQEMIDDRVTNRPSKIK